MKYCFCEVLVCDVCFVVCVVDECYVMYGVCDVFE